MDNPYIICYSRNATWHHYDEQKPGYRGYLVDLMDIISKSANFSYEESTLCGRKLCMSALLAEDCDIVVGPHSPTYALDMMFLHSLGYYTTDYVIISSQAENTVSFHLEVNLQIAAVTILTATMCSLITYVADYVGHKMKHGNSLKTKFSDAIWSYFSTIFLEPYALPKFSISSSILQMFWWFTLIILLSAVGGSLKATVATSKESVINTLQDIIDRPEIKPVTIFGTFAYMTITLSNNDVIQKINVRMEKNAISVTLNEFENNPHKLLQNGNALIEDQTSILEILSSKCSVNWQPKLYISNQVVWALYYAIGMREGVPDDVREIINRKVISFAETNQMIPGIRKFYRETSHCFRSNRKWQGLNNQLEFLCWLWLSGIAVSTLSLLLEIVVFKAQIVFFYENNAVNNYALT